MRGGKQRRFSAKSINSTQQPQYIMPQELPNLWPWLSCRCLFLQLSFWKCWGSFAHCMHYCAQVGCCLRLPLLARETRGAPRFLSSFKCPRRKKAIYEMTNLFLLVRLFNEMSSLACFIWKLVQLPLEVLPEKANPRFFFMWTHNLSVKLYVSVRVQSNRQQKLLQPEYWGELQRIARLNPNHKNNTAGEKKMVFLPWRARHPPGNEGKHCGLWWRNMNNFCVHNSTTGLCLPIILVDCYD